VSIFRTDVLAGRVALITGGATGICNGIARTYASHGARVCIVSRKEEALRAAAREIEAQCGAPVLAVPADVREPEAVARAVSACVGQLGGLDILVNGAAGNFLAPAAALSERGFRTVVEIDLLGTFHTCKAAFDALCASGRGLILNISATLHYHGTPLQIHAAAAKAGVDALTRTLAVEWGRFGVRSVAIAPGPIGDTEGMRRLAPGDVGKRLIENIPLGRFGTIQEIADLAVYLATDAAAYITGAVYVVDGGQSVAVPARLMDQ
jgi:2,4-dienoyl-CoA reductase [(3E)-enoyl-CoA-producing], peroxisomal